MNDGVFPVSIKSEKGFTLIELMVACAIIALLTAVAIPQFVRFRSKAIRAEAYIGLNSGYKAQLAYYSGADHFLTGPGSYAGGTIVTEDPSIAVDLGLEPKIVDSTAFTANGYSYFWQFFLDSYVNGQYGNGYFLELAAPIIPGDEADNWNDVLFIGMNAQGWVNFCGSCGYQNGVPFLYSDEITRTMNCPC